jgi:hypothetical protein
VCRFQQKASDSVMQQVYAQLIRPTMDDAPADTLTGLQWICDKSKYGFVADSTRAASVMNNVTCAIVSLPRAFIPATGTFVIGKHCPYSRIINSKYADTTGEFSLYRLLGCFTLQGRWRSHVLSKRWCKTRRQH